MSKIAMVRARLEPSLKNETEKLLHQMGLTASQAINAFLSPDHVAKRPAV